MDIKKVLTAVGKLVGEVEQLPEIERYHAYATMKMLCDEIVEYAKTIRNGNPELYAEELTHTLLWHFGSVCNLYDGNGHPANQHVVWCLGEINKIESFHCLDLMNLC